METADITHKPSLVRVAIGFLTALMLFPVFALLAALPAAAVAMSVREVEIEWWEQLLYWVWLVVVLGVAFLTLRALYRWVRRGTPPPASKRHQPEPETSYIQFGDRFDGGDRMSDHSAPGWHPDPSGEHEMRYWDGTAWTGRVITRNRPSQEPARPGNTMLAPASTRSRQATTPPGDFAALTACPSCGGRVSKQAPSCPHCGHTVHPMKTGATKVLVFGIISLLPAYGLVFGPLAWGFGNREVREIDAGRRMPRSRGKARTGRLLGIIGLAISVLIIAISAVTLDDAPPQARVDPQQLFAEHGIEFYSPGNWEEMNFSPLPQPLWRYAVTPDPSSGNWIMFLYIPRAVAADWSATEETFGSFLDVFAGGDPARFADGPGEVEIAGVNGVEASIAGLAGSRTGQPLLAEAVILYGAEASYVLIAQYEPAHQVTMLAVWGAVLERLELPSAGRHVDLEDRASPVDLEHPRFDYLDTTGSSLVGGAWYDEEEDYLVVQTRDAYYQHCGMSAETWAAFTEASSFDSFYYMSVVGRFECRDGGVPEYDDRAEPGYVAA